ncbi:VOC family protein [Nocardia farcinica]|nr:VOC family protein [Nocardia farcinica]
MGIELNHTIVGARDRHRSARFLADVLGVSVGAEVGPFVPVVLDNSVTLDYMAQDEVQPQHYAFLVGDAEFDAAFERIRAAGITYWADPGHAEPGEINHRWGGRGVYFEDPDGHNMEILTRTP